MRLADVANEVFSWVQSLHMRRFRALAVSLEDQITLTASKGHSAELNAGVLVPPEFPQLAGSVFVAEKQRVAKMRVYLIAYHSQPSQVCQGSGRYLEVEKAIQESEWPYDNGDDPSFFASRRDGGSLTWGVCRPDVRNSVEPGSVCVFFAYTQVSGEIRYRLSAVATVAHRLDRRNISQNSAFNGARYINLLIRREGNVWVYDESDRPELDRHNDWLWRIAAGRTRKKTVFENQHKLIYEAGRFDDGDLQIGENYVVFSDRADLTYISKAPPHVATARPSDEHETWCAEALRNLTVAKAAEFNGQRRDYLRTGAAGYPHRQLVFGMPDSEGVEWRRSLIAALAAHESG